MDFKVIITRSAAQDLRNVTAFIARDHPDAALKLGNHILDRFDSLAKSPFIGRAVPELEKSEWREVIYRSYRLIYRVDEAKEKNLRGSNLAFGARNASSA